MHRTNRGPDGTTAQMQKLNGGPFFIARDMRLTGAVGNQVEECQTRNQVLRQKPQSRQSVPIVRHVMPPHMACDLIFVGFFLSRLEKAKPSRQLPELFDVNNKHVRCAYICNVLLFSTPSYCNILSFFSVYM